MDTSASKINFDIDGNCNYCNRLIRMIDNGGFLNEQSCASDISELLKEIKAVYKNKKTKSKYDCIVGVSGGIDSSYTLVKAVELGLNPLAVHMDNGWNSELANNNISNIVSKLGVDLHTHVIKWPEYRFLMQSFFDADVLDIELLYDNAMRAVNYRLAQKHGIKHILSGVNTSTEGIGIPQGWNWFKTDKKNILAIAKLRDRNYEFDTFPSISTLQTIKYYIKGCQFVPFLDYFEYKKDFAKEYLVSQYSYKPYPYKHYENIFTRFYQGYILPNKFSIDKRRAHLSTLIICGQITRDCAISTLEEIPYPDVNELENDKRYFLKKMRWSKKDLEDYLERPEVPHSKYPTEYLIHYCFNIFKKLRARYL